MITQPSLWGALKDEIDNGVWRLCGSGLPSSTTGAGFAGLGSSYVDVSTGFSYKNYGTAAAPVWIITGGDAVKTATGTISAADLTGTGAGQFGHANGYIVVPAPGANKVVWPYAAILSYVRATATYGAGGNTTLNWGAGGAAITGLVSAANFAGAAADKPVALVPLATAGIALVANAPLNLVSSAAFTNPGTAAGVIYYKILYTLQNLNTAL